MKAKRTMIFPLIINLVLLSNAFSQERMLEGEISAIGKYIGVTAGEGGKAKFTEYRDLKENGGAYARAKLQYNTEKYFLNFEGGDFVYGTQYYKIGGGMWGKLKSDLFYDEISHNITFDARTFFTGAGHDALTGAPNTNVDSWNTFDYSTERRKYGAGFKVDMLRPFFFDMSYSREEKEGIIPVGVAGTTPGGIGIELPEPVDFLTNNLNLSAGYAKNPLFLSLNGFYSQFNESSSLLHFSNPATGAADALTLPPDSQYYKVAFKGGIKLPFNNRLNTNLGYGRTTSDHSFFPSFDGEVKNQNYDFVLTSRPVRFLDAKVYYKYYKRDNKSDDPLGIVDVFFDYKKDTYGAEVGVRLPARFHLTGGYKYVKAEREEVGETNPALVLPFNRDNIYSGELKWSGLDFMDVKVGYEKLDRDAQYRTVESAVAPDRRFSYAAQDRDTYEAAIDIFPLENLNLGFEYQHKNIDYTDTIYGLLKDKRDNFDISADYTIGSIAKLYGYSSYEFMKFVQLQFITGATGGPAEVKMKETGYGYGVGTEIYAIPKKLTLIFQHDYLKSNGSVDLTYQDPDLFANAGIAGADNDIIDILRWDDYTKYSFKTKAVYNFTKSLSASIGYAYERFKYSDAQLDDYQFVPAAAGTNGAYLTGAYKDQSYKANVVFGGLTYKF